MDGFQWNEIILRFPHIAEKIFEGLDDQSLTSCRLVEKSWKNVIDGRNYPWERIVKKSNLKDGNTYLHLAAKHGQTEMFEKIFNKETKKNPGNKNEGTPFHVACEKGHVRIAEFIIKNSNENNINLNTNTTGYDRWNCRDINGFTGFHYACRGGDVELVELLVKNSVECNIDLNTKDIGGRTGFHCACSSGQIKVVELLIKNSVEFNMDLNAKNNNDGKTGFHYASDYYGRIELVELLIKNSVEFNIDLNVKDRDGKTSFHFACQNKNVKLVELLIKNSVEYNIDLNVKDDWQRGGRNGRLTGFHYACKSGNVKIVELLIKKSVECNINLNAIDDWKRCGKKGAGKTGYNYSIGLVRRMILDNAAQFNIDLKMYE